MIISREQLTTNAKIWIDMLHQLLSIIILMSVTTSAWAVPEIARYGHFTCVSCHVSPSGGSTLTSYGRLFAAEKLSTWTFEDEENPAHGLAPVSDTLLLGGDFRWVDLRRNSEGNKFKKFWRMQSDVEPGLHTKNFWLTLTLGTKPAGPVTTDKEPNKIVIRGYAARFDIFDEHLILRAGMFIPKYGLMLSDHTAYVRQIVDLGPDTEQTQLESIFQDDRLELTLAAIIKDEHLERQGKSKSGINLGLSVRIGKKHRLNLHSLHTSLNVKDTLERIQAIGTSGIITLTNRIFAMFEINQAQSSFKSTEIESKETKIASFGSLSLETIRGLIPYVRLEHQQKSETATSKLEHRWGLGNNWYMRPHIQIDGRVMRQMDAKTKKTVDSSSLIIHYYF